MKAKSTKKEESLRNWKSLPERQDPLRVMTPIAYKATGSSYGACGIRIDGNPAFIDAVLSNLKTIINGENHITRLELARSEVNGQNLGKVFNKKEDGAEVCYIRLHMRGVEGAMASAVFDKHLDHATEQFCNV